MDIGVSIFPTQYAIRIDELAKELEARGFESLAVPEHTHIPASRKSPWPAGGDLPREYWNTLDPFVGLMAAAAVTEKLRLITGIILLTERDPLRVRQRGGESRLSLQRTFGDRYRGRMEPRRDGEPRD